MNINFVTPINGTSYGLTASYLLHHLVNLDNVALFPIGEVQPVYPFFQQSVATALNNAQFFDPNAICIRKFHPNDMALRIGKKTAGFTVFELEDLRPVEKHQLSTLDAIIVPTDWQSRVITKNGITNISIYKVPLGVDQNIFKPMKIDIPNKPYQFITVGKWEERKNYKQLLEAFDLAFSPADDVELHLLTFSWIKPAVERMQRELPRLLDKMKIGYKVKIYPNQFIPPEKLAQIYNMCDCGITVSHAEGFNLPLLEMLACGLPVIATNVTGHTEYLKQEHGRLIEPIGNEEAYDELFFRDKHGKWYTFATEQIAEEMRYAYNNFKKQDFTHNAKIADIYNWEQSAIQLHKVCLQIEKEN